MDYVKGMPASEQQNLVVYFQLLIAPHIPGYPNPLWQIIRLPLSTFIYEQISHFYLLL